MPAPAYPDHADLRVYRDASGALRPIESPAEWAVRRDHVLEGMQEATGPLPSRESLPPLDPQVTEVLERPAYTRQTVRFVAERIGGREDRVPAYLYLPRHRPGRPAPAMLALHQTHPLGKGDVDAEKGRTNRCYASELASRGYVVLAPDYPSFGDYAYDFAQGGYPSGTIKGVFNHMRAVDLLQARPEVDGQRIGAIGHSLGGHNSIFVAVFDPRIRVVVSSCGWTPFHDYYGGRIAGWTSDRYMPRLRDAYGLDAGRVPFDFYELIAALAPRGFFSSSPLRDDNFDFRGVQKAEAAAGEVYRLLGAAASLQVIYPDCEHDFPPEVRQAAYAFIDRMLSHQPAGGTEWL